MNKNINVVAINDLIDINHLYLLKYDSTHGKINAKIEVNGDYLYVDGKKIRVTKEKNLQNLNWKDVSAEYIVDSTGLFLTEELASLHITSGAKKVIMSALPKIILQCL